jgi:hypothetical protein
MTLVRQKPVLSRVLWAGLLLLAITAGAYAQNGGKLGKIAILPFTGGATTDEQNGIPEWIAHTNNLIRNFDVAFRTDIIQEAEWEQLFQHESGMIDSNDAVRLGNRLNAEYVMTGSTISLGNQKLLIVSIINLQDIRQVAGDYLKYNSIDDVIMDSSILNKMTGNLVEMVRNQKDNLPPLALLRVRLEGGAKEAEGDAMAQILAIHLLREGGWAVCPRVTLEEVQSEYKTQLESGTTRDSGKVRAGDAMVPQHVLAVVSRVIGATNTFIADITVIEDGVWYDGSTEVYTSLNDGMNVMGLLARKLSGRELSVKDQDVRARTLKTDNFLKSFSIGFGGWGGFALWGTGPGEPIKGINEETGEEYTSWLNTPSFEGGVILGVRYRFISIESGVNFIWDHAKYTPSGGEEKYAALHILQIPILTRVSFSLVPVPDGHLNIAVFGGLGLNTTVSSPDAGSTDLGGLSFIAGGDIEIGMGKIVYITQGYQYNGSINGGTITVDGVPYDHKSGIHSVILGLKFFIPLRKDDGAARW